MIEYLSYFLIFLGLFFLLTAVIGLNRLPDFLCKMHAATIADVVGCPCILLGIALQCKSFKLSLKIGFLVLLLLILNPVASYMLNKIALNKEDIKK